MATMPVHRRRPSQEVIAEERARLMDEYAWMERWEQIPTVNRAIERFVLARRPSIPPSLRKAVYERDEYTCQDCGTHDALSLDHIIPFSLDGEDTLENLRTLCTPCNSRRGNRV